MKEPAKKRTRKNVPKGFDSWLEYDLYQKLRRCEYHPDRIDYVQHKQYEPDFVYYDDKEQIKTFIEVKGRFRDRAEAKKYVDVRSSLQRSDIECVFELVFIFQNPNTAMPAARRRADGTRFTMADWAVKNGFTYYTPDTVPLEWSVKR